MVGGAEVFVFTNRVVSDINRWIALDLFGANL